MAKKRSPYYANALVNPVHQTATYYFESTEQVIAYHEGESDVGRYARYDNPSWLEVEEKLATLDNTERALLFPSGMSAICTALLSLVGADDKLIFTGKGYRNIRSFCFDVLAKVGPQVITLPLISDDGIYDILEKECSDNLKVVFIESPSNPHLFLVDVERVRKIVGDSCIIIVDSTLSSPVNFRPMEFGADLVIHSCGKYIGGHADLMAGSVAGRQELIEQIRATRNVTGAIMDPHAAFLLNRSLGTLGMRMQHLNAAGQKLADYLASRDDISAVYYTGLAAHPQHQLAQKQLSGHGGVVTFEVQGDKSSVSRIVDEVKLPYMGTNFGSSHSMIEQLSIFTYYTQSQQERDDLGIKDNMIRYSIGFDDDVDDIINDLDAAIEASKAESR